MKYFWLVAGNGRNWRVEADSPTSALRRGYMKNPEIAGSDIEYILEPTGNTDQWPSPKERIAYRLISGVLV